MLRKYKLKLCFIIFIFSVFFFSCSTVSNKPLLNFSVIENTNKEFEWESFEEGFWISHLYYKDYPLVLHAVKIDLTNPKLKVVTTEADMFRKKDMKVKRETTKSFAKRNNTILAVNAAFFRVKSYLFTSYAKVLGLHISKGKILNPIDKKFDVAYFFNDGNVLLLNYEDSFEFIGNDKKYKIEDIKVAVGGHKIILKNGKHINKLNYKPEDSRTCIGLSKDKKILYILFIEAENKQKSRGVTYDQTYFFMKKLGASDALQLDGGGSSSLIIRKKTASGKDKFVKVVPSMGFWGLRKVATNIGFVLSE